MRRLILMIFIMIMAQNCKKDTLLCYTPPPRLAFLLLNKDSKPLLTDQNLGTLQIWYRKDAKMLQWNIPLVSPHIFRNTEALIIFSMKELIDQSPEILLFDFEIHLEGKKITNVLAKISQTDNKDCNNWRFMSELRFENKIINHSALDEVYTLKFD